MTMAILRIWLPNASLASCGRQCLQRQETLSVLTELSVYPTSSFVPPLASSSSVSNTPMSRTLLITSLIGCSEYSQCFNTCDLRNVQNSFLYSTCVVATYRVAVKPFLQVWKTRCRCIIFKVYNYSSLDGFKIASLFLTPDIDPARFPSNVVQMLTQLEMSYVHVKPLNSQHAS